MKPVLDDLPAIQGVRGQIERLYQTDPHIHIDISPSPKLHFSNDAATIIGVYPFIFRIEEYTGGSPKQHTLQYTDVLIKKIVIRELEKSGE